MPSPRTGLLLLAALALTGVVRADDADPVVIRVGGLAMRSSDVARRLAAIPAFQIATFGQDPMEAKKRFVDTVLVPEMLYSAEADRRNLGRTPSVERRVHDALRRALVESVRAETVLAGVPEAEVRAHYEAHASDYHRPERLRLFRILVDDDALARKIVAEAKGTGGPERWSALAREHSIDAATKLRGGVLGFVLPDGRTEVPQLSVDPALYAAAAKVKDGEIVPEPVHEGTHLAVVWRRGTLPKLDRSYEVEHDAITTLLVRERVDRAVAALALRLRGDSVKDENPALLDSLPKEPPPPPPLERQPSPREEPGALRPAPAPSERGLR